MLLALKNYKIFKNWNKLSPKLFEYLKNLFIEKSLDYFYFNYKLWKFVYLGKMNLLDLFIKKFDMNESLVL